MTQGFDHLLRFREIEYEIEELKAEIQETVPENVDRNSALYRLDECKAFLKEALELEEE